MRLRRARWKAWLWAFAIPGSVEPAQPGGAAGRRHARRDRGDAVAVELEQHVGFGRLAAQPGELAVEHGRARHGQDPTRPTNARDALDERVPVEPLELLPRGERRRVGDTVEEQAPVEVVALVLERAGGEAALDLVVGDAVAVEVTDPDGHVAVDRAAQVGHRQAALR